MESSVFNMIVSFEAFVIDIKRLATFEAKVEKSVADEPSTFFSTASRRPVSSSFFVKRNSISSTASFPSTISWRPALVVFNVFTSSSRARTLSVRRFNWSRKLPVFLLVLLLTTVKSKKLNTNFLIFILRKLILKLHRKFQCVWSKIRFSK